jgi:hypothetical protein
MRLHREPFRLGLMRWIWPQYAAVLLPALLTLAGIIGAVELVYRIAGGVDAGETSWKLFGLAVDAKSWPPWTIAFALLAAGGWLLAKTWRGVVWQWKMVMLATSRGESK